MSWVSLDARRGQLVQLTRFQAALLVSSVAALLVFPPIGQRIIASSDEARFALLARDVLERGVWFDLQVRGKQYRNKPPLYPWSIAALSRIGGRVTEVTARAPVAVAAIGCVLFTFFLGDRLFGRRAALWAALILATSYGFFAQSQVVLPDMLVLCFATVAGYAFWRAAGEAERRGALVAFYAALAFGVFAKGPVGLLPLLVAGIWLWTEHGPKGALARLWSPLGVSVFVLVTLVWLGPFLALGGRSFAGSVFWEDWLDWYLGLPTARTLSNAVEDAVVGFMPWTLVAPLALAGAVRGRPSPAVRFALLWFLVPLLVILLAENQRTRYLVLIYPGLALLTGWWADARGTQPTKFGGVIAWLSLAAVALALVAFAAPRRFGLEDLPLAIGISWEALPLIAGAAVAGGALFWGLRAGRPGLLVYGVVGAMVVVLGYGVWPYNQRFNERWDFRRLAASIERHARDGEAAVFTGNVYGGRWFSIDLYARRPLRPIQTIPEFNAYVARTDRPAVLVRGAIWEIIQGEIAPDVRVLEEMTVGGQEMLIVRGGS